MPKNWGESTTVVAALTLDGIVAPMVRQGPVDQNPFDAYVEQSDRFDQAWALLAATNELTVTTVDNVVDIRRAKGTRSSGR